jgi:DNA helicase II / ATP-dependent DNA helicase PcrA
MPWNQDLTGKPLQIAQTTSPRIRVMAGPGTGKSFALQRRLVRLLEDGMDPKRILVVTFTRTAAASLVSEIGSLGIEGCQSIIASTLHSYCFRLLMKQAVLDFTGRVPRALVTIASHGVLQFEAAPLLEDLNSPDKYGDKRERTKRIRAFEAVWARLQNDEPGWTPDSVDVEFEEDLKGWLSFHRCILVGELVPEALRFLRTNPASGARDAFLHVLVDEYQDLNKAEQVLLDILSENGHQGVVGDEDQSIYRFRHAHPEGIVQYADGHPGTDDHVLDECRRCPKLVVSMADQLIRRNHPASSTPRLAPRATNPAGEVRIVQWDSLDDEIAGIADFVTHLVTDRGFQPGEILVLCPRRLIGYSIRDRLVAANIPTHSFYHEEAVEEDEAQEAFSLLTLLADPEDRVALRFFLGFGSSSWLANQYELIRDSSEQSGLSPFAVMEDLANQRITIAKTSNILKRFNVLKARLEQLRGLEGKSLVDEIFPSGETWAATLREAALIACEGLSNPIDILDYLKTRITQPEMPEDGKFVRIMSLHKSKGLTSRAVVVSSCIEGLIPFTDDNASANEQDAIVREQRRLFYVAITRCTELLMISSFLKIPTKLAYKIGAKVSRWGWKEKATIASRFLAELGPNVPRAVRGESVVPRRSKQDTSQAISSETSS